MELCQDGIHPPSKILRPADKHVVLGTQRLVLRLQLSDFRLKLDDLALSSVSV